MTSVWLSVCMFGAVVVEAATGVMGVPWPLVGCTGFYLAVVFGWRRAGLPVLAGQAALDVLVGRPGPVGVGAMLVVLWLAGVWRQQGDCRQTLLQVVPGGLVGLIQVGGVALVQAWIAPPVTGPVLVRPCLLALAGAVLGAIVLPPLCRVLDRAAGALRLLRYTEVQREVSGRAG